MKKFFISSYLLALTMSPAMAASDDIMSDRQNECAIWLCLPGGFGPGCEAAHAAYIKRISAFSGGDRPQRLYTDLPRFELCKDDNPPGIDDFNVGPESEITYKGAYEINMPSYNTCTRWGYRYHGQGNAQITVKYCAAVKTTPARTFDSQQKHHKYQTIEVGQRNYTNGVAPSRHYTEVLVDGKMVGNRHYD